MTKLPNKLAEFINRRDEDRHRQFCAFLDADETGKLHSVMENFLEELQEDVTMRLCNYSTLIDGHGKEHDIPEVAGGLAAEMGRIYKQFTGRHHTPSICRVAALRGATP